MIKRFSAPVTQVERIGLIVALALATALVWPLRDYLTDDTFIHLQYARNLANGHGLVFNPGERVYGCTSPLWVTLIADAMALGFDGLVTARVIGFVATLASVGLFLQLMRRTVRTPELRAAATIAWAGHAWMLRWSVSGMETPLAVALIVAGFVAFTEGDRWGARPVRTGALWALAALTRPEAVLLLMLWAAFLLIDAENRDGLRRLVAGTLPPLVIYGAWLLFARLYFGTFWPQTLSAKTAGNVTFAFHLDNLWRQARLVMATDGLPVLALALAVLFGGRRLWPGVPATQRLVPWAWLLALPLLYMARGVTVISRYLLPVLPVLDWLAWHASEAWWIGHPETPAKARRVRMLAILLTSATLIQNLVVYTAVVLPQVTSFTPALRTSLIRWGEWFDRNTPPEAVIATPDIGAIGYFSRRQVIDLAGLVTAGMVPHLQRETQEDAIAAFRFASFSRPDYLIDRAPQAWDLERRSPYAACLERLGHAGVPNLGIARPDPAVYSIYRVHWSAFDSLRAQRVR